MKYEIPLSEELEGKSSYPRSKEECVAELRRIAELEPEKVITRNYFRVHSDIKESVWNRHFGTFEEFKRQAGIKLTRHQHKMEINIALHASVDTHRDMNKQKAGYEGKYLKDVSRRFQTIMHATDIHDKDCDPFWLRIFFDTIARIKPEKLILGGDLFDLPEFSKYDIDPRSWDVVGRITWVHQFLAQIRDLSPETELTLVEGNHEFRLLQHLSESSPSMRAVLSDLHGFTVPKLLGLDAYEVNYVSRSNLAVFNKKDVDSQTARNYHIAYDCYLTHHFPHGKKLGMPGGNGHHHKHIVTPFHSPMFGSYEWHQLGAGCRRRASYCEGELWSMGFMIAHIDTLNKKVLNEYVPVNQDYAVVGGKFFKRELNEL